MSQSIAAAAALRRSLCRFSSSPSFSLRLLRPLSYSSHSFIPIRAAIPAALARPSLLSVRHSSSKQATKGDKLNSILESELDCALSEETKEVEFPDDFPFEIVDNPGDQGILLKRNYNGEKIEVSVMLNVDDLDDDAQQEEDDENDEDDKGDEEDEGAGVCAPIDLLAMVDKGEGPTLEFGCSLTPDGLEIQSMLLKGRDNPDDENAYQGPEFSDLDPKLQQSFHGYLEDRYIKSSLYTFLYEYMLVKDQKEYITWLRGMKTFVGKK